MTVSHSGTSGVAAYEPWEELCFKLPEEVSSIVSIPNSSGTCNMLTTLAVTILGYDKGLRHDWANFTADGPPELLGPCLGQLQWEQQWNLYIFTTSYKYWGSCFGEIRPNFPDQTEKMETYHFEDAHGNVNNG